MVGNTTDDPAAAGIGDRRRRFLFKEMDLRGELVRLDNVITDVSAIHSYPPGVTRLLGEFLAAAVLLASTLKFRGALTVQARSEQQVPLIMAECNSRLEVRAIARGAQEATADSFQELIGGGQLAITVMPEKGQRYQGIVPLTDDSLASSLDSYFTQSAQLHSRLLLCCDGQRAAGLLLQQLPRQRVRDQDQREEQWQRINHLASTLSDEELLGLSEETLLRRLYHEETLRLFESENVHFSCSCSRERTLSALASVGRAEIDDILKEQGAVTMDCEFCNQRYLFEEADLTTPDSVSTLH